MPFRVALTLLPVLLLPGPSLLAAQAWCNVDPDYDCFEPDSADWAEIEDLLEHLEFQNQQHEIPVCEDLTQENWDLHSDDLIWIGDIDGDSATGASMEGEDPPIMLDDDVVYDSDPVEGAKTLIHEQCHLQNDMGYEEEEIYCRWLEDEYVRGGAQQEEDSQLPDEKLDWMAEVSGPWAPATLAFDASGRKRIPVVPRAADTTGIVMAVADALTKNWPRERVILRARPSLAPAVSEATLARGTSQDECGEAACVRDSKLILRYLDVTTEGNEAGVRVEIITLGVDFEPYIALFDVALQQHVAGSWRVADMAPRSGGSDDAVPWPLPGVPERSYATAPDTAGVLTSIADVMTRGWPGERITLRAEPGLEAAVEESRRAMDASQDQRGSVEVVRDGKMILRFSGVSITGDTAVAHVALVRLGPTFEVAMQSFEVELHHDGGWTIVDMEPGAVY